MIKLVVILHNIRSTHNVGAIFRTAECLGAERIILSGYTPAPKFIGDTRLPHIADKLHAQIHKTALGAETLVPFSVHTQPPLDELHAQGYRIAALEQSTNSVDLNNYDTPPKLALILGEEVDGVHADILHACDDIIEIPMHGRKESLNVSIAAGIAMHVLLN